MLGLFQPRKTSEFCTSTISKTSGSPGTVKQFFRLMKNMLNECLTFIICSFNMSNINAVLTQRCNSRDPDSVLSTRLQIINDIILYNIHISDLDSLKTNFMKVIIPQRGNIDFVTKSVVINTFSDNCWWIPLNMN